LPHAMLEIRNAFHAYGDVVALDDVSVSAEPGEFLTILGESGSGKTTLLRLISGLETASRVAALRLNGADVSGVPANMRDCTTVFQHYALFPHMTVGANVEYGLKVRRIPPQERRQRALDALNLVRLGDKYDRRIHQLSGGERQRVALARAVVPNPAILLLDEPLGALDEKLRIDMQVELLELHRRLGMTFVYITHSQEEALTMSDRIILMRKGKIAQQGPPQDLFDRPANRFVAAFMGFENLFDGVVASSSGEHLTVNVGNAELGAIWTGERAPTPGASVVVGVRAERVRLESSRPMDASINVVSGRVDAEIYKGKYLDRTMVTEFGPVSVRLWNSSAPSVESTLVCWSKADCVAMSP
jgi:spermidine/putrescine transport system ATP-binding protein